MIITRILPVVALTLLTAPAFGADANGYSAQYECRAGGPKCNVDVASLAAQPCQQTVTTSTTPTSDWSAIDWSKSVICIQAGDHTGRGTLTLQSSGTASNYKVLRYYRSSDTDDEPWNQISNQAKIALLDTNSNSYWLIHRIAIDSSQSSSLIIVNGSYNILNRTLIENHGSFVSTEGATRNNIQNGVMRNFKLQPSTDIGCINLGWVDSVYVVNNEFYGCTDGVVATQGAPGTAGTVIENNDFWVPPSYYSGPNYSCVENAVDIKSGGMASKPVRLIHNRAWGFKATSTSCGGTGDAGAAMNVHCPSCQAANYVAFVNNIVADSYAGIVTPNGGTMYHSFIGNLFYNIANPVDPNWQYPLFSAKANYSEIYLNTVVGANATFAGGPSDDVLCNAFILSGNTPGSAGAGGTVDYNAYYSTADSSEVHKVTPAIRMRANSTAYGVGDVIRTTESANCQSANDPACFLYIVTASGVSRSSPPAYCTMLGCTMTDGSLTLQAIRGPLSYRRKLKTVPGGELAVIPYALAHSSAPESRCMGNPGSRGGVGVNDAPLF